MTCGDWAWCVLPFDPRQLNRSYTTKLPFRYLPILLLSHPPTSTGLVFLAICHTWPNVGPPRLTSPPPPPPLRMTHPPPLQVTMPSHHATMPPCHHAIPASSSCAYIGLVCNVGACLHRISLPPSGSPLGWSWVHRYRANTTGDIRAPTGAVSAPLHDFGAATCPAGPFCNVDGHSLPPWRLCVGNPPPPPPKQPDMGHMALTVGYPMAQNGSSASPLSWKLCRTRYGPQGVSAPFGAVLARFWPDGDVCRLSTTVMLSALIPLPFPCRFSIRCAACSCPSQDPTFWPLFDKSRRLFHYPPRHT